MTPQMTVHLVPVSVVVVCTELALVQCRLTYLTNNVKGKPVEHSRHVYATGFWITTLANLVSK